MATTSMRWGVFRSLVTALRVSTRAGSPGILERLAALPRLTLATALGRYTGTSVKRLLILAGAVLYVVSPVDLMPEGLLGVFGLGDDAVVITWIAVAVVNETEAFLAWEHDRPRSSRSWWRPHGDVIHGEVIPATSPAEAGRSGVV